MPAPMQQVHTPMRILRSKEGLIIPIIRRRAPFRGFGVTQTCFAIGIRMLNMMADEIGITPFGRSVTAMPFVREVFFRMGRS